MPDLRPADDCSRTQLYMLRIWQEDLRDGRSEWRGRVQQVANDHVRYFSSWTALAACLEEMAAPSRSGSHSVAPAT